MIMKKIDNSASKNLLYNKLPNTDKAKQLLKKLPQNLTHATHAVVDVAKSGSEGLVHGTEHLVQKVKAIATTVAETVGGEKTPMVKNPHYAVRQKSYNYDDLIACATGELFGVGNPQLPLPNMLMMDRITYISESGGKFGKGEMIAELDIKPNLWFFDCHFKNDPVMPGCLGLDAMWQMLGFFLGWMGGIGRGRALGLGNLKFSGEILPITKLVTYKVEIKRVVMNRLILGVADSMLLADGKMVYQAEDLKVGLFKNA